MKFIHWYLLTRSPVFIFLATLAVDELNILQLNEVYIDVATSSSISFIILLLAMPLDFIFRENSYELNSMLENYSQYMGVRFIRDYKKKEYPIYEIQHFNRIVFKLPFRTRVTFYPSRWTMQVYDRARLVDYNTALDVNNTKTMPYLLMYAYGLEKTHYHALQKRYIQSHGIRLENEKHPLSLYFFWDSFYHEDADIEKVYLFWSQQYDPMKYLPLANAEIDWIEDLIILPDIWINSIIEPAEGVARLFDLL